DPERVDPATARNASPYSAGGGGATPGDGAGDRRHRGHPGDSAGRVDTLIRVAVSAAWSGRAEPAAQHRGTVADLSYFDMLVGGVREHRIPRPVVQRGRPQVVEPRDIGPAQLRHGGRADGGEELPRQRRGQAGRRSSRRIDHLDLEALEDLTDVRVGLLL